MDFWNVLYIYLAENLTYRIGSAKKHFAFGRRCVQFYIFLIFTEIFLHENDQIQISLRIYDKQTKQRDNVRRLRQTRGDSSTSALPGRHRGTLTAKRNPGHNQEADGEMED